MTTKLNLKIVGKGRPLILLHGFGWHSGIWSPLVPQLTENFQLFLIDLPGFGKSPLLTADYKIDEIATLLLDITPPTACWLGWSLGGMIAWHIAIHHPERVSSLVTLASSPKFIRTENWPGVSHETLKNFSKLLSQNYQKTLHEFLELQLRGSPKNTEMMTKLQKKISSTSLSSIPALLGGLKLLSELDLRSQLTKISCPSLHLFGRNDTLVPDKIAHMIQPQLQFGKCEIIQRSGHIPFLSQTEIFLNYLREFCQL